MAIIRGTNGNETLNGTPNNDQIFGLGGDDRLFGLGGNDTLFGGRGDDRTDGGAGSDTFSVRDAPYNWSIDLAEDSALAFEFNSDREFDFDRVIAIENVDGSAGDDVIDGDAGSNTLLGNGGNDILRGSGGDDVLRGGDGDDAFGGGAGDDVIDGGAGRDTYSSSSDSQPLQVDLATGRATEGGGVDRLTGIEDANGGFLNDVLRGNGGANSLSGNEGRDLLDGRGGADELLGFQGNDTLNGGGGSDTLQGDAGNDRLTGGEGGDSFQARISGFGYDFDGTGQDVVTDFSRSQGDQLGIQAGVGTPADAFDQFDTNSNGLIDNADGSSEVNGIRFDSSVGASTVLSLEDLSGPGAGDSLQLTVEDVTDLRQSDFVL